jgi:hypothetical protein
MRGFHMRRKQHFAYSYSTFSCKIWRQYLLIRPHLLDNFVKELTCLICGQQTWIDLYATGDIDPGPLIPRQLCMMAKNEQFAKRIMHVCLVVLQFSSKKCRNNILQSLQRTVPNASHSAFLPCLFNLSQFTQTNVTPVEPIPPFHV